MGADTLTALARPGRLADLQGAIVVPLETQERFAEFERVDTASYIAGKVDDIQTAVWDIGDAALYFFASVPDRATDRAQAMRELLAEINEHCPEAHHTTETVLYAAMRRARAFPPALRRKFEDKPATWFQDLCDRTSVATDSAEERFARIAEYAERCAPLNTTETRALLDSDPRLGLAKRRARRELHLPDEPPPAPTEAPMARVVTVEAAPEHVGTDDTADRAELYTELYNHFNLYLGDEWDADSLHQAAAVAVGFISQRYR